MYYKVLLSDIPPAFSLQPASLVVPPCQDIAYHIPNQEDNKVVKNERERERLRHHHHATAHPSIKLSFTVSKKSDILYATHSIERARGLHSTSSSSFYLLYYCIVTSAERGKCKSMIDSLNCSLKVLMNLCILLSNLSSSIVQTSSKVKNYSVGGTS